MSIDFPTLSATELRDGFIKGDFSPREAMEATVARLEQTHEFNTFIFTDLETALEQAAEAETAYRRGEWKDRPLLGIPVAVKDLIDVAGMPTTCGSVIPGEAPAASDGACVARVREAGGVVVGKTHMYEFAWGITSENPAFGACLNPWDKGRSAGGSSSGSAAALALKQVPLAIGTDTAGSIRLPASICGVLGIKPSSGRVDTAGSFPLAPTLDEIGPMARTPADLRFFLDVLSGGRSPHAGGSREGHGDVGLVRGRRVAVWFGDEDLPPDPQVVEAIETVAELLRELGCELDVIASPVNLPALENFSLIQLAEAKDAHARHGYFPRFHDRYATELVERFDRADRITIEQYMEATRVRRQIVNAFGQLFRDFDLLLGPACPVMVPRIEELATVRYGNDVSFREQVLGYTVPQSLSGVPAASVRAGFDSHGMPIGVQLTGPFGSDEVLISVVGEFWQATRELQARWPEPAGVGQAKNGDRRQ